MYKCKNVLHWLQIYAPQEHAPLISIIPMQKLVLSYERSSRTHPLHEMQPPCTWKSIRSHKKYINHVNKNTYIPPTNSLLLWMWTGLQLHLWLMLQPSQHAALPPFCSPNNLMHSLLTTTSSHDVSHKLLSHCTNTVSLFTTQFNIIHCERTFSNNVIFVFVTFSCGIMNKWILLLVLLLLSLILHIQDV